MSRLATWLLYATLFLLPWQARWIFSPVELNGQAWEYGQLCVYAVQIVLALTVIFTLQTKPDYRQLKRWWPVWALAAWAALSALWSTNPAVSLYHATLLIWASLLGECILMLKPSRWRIAHVLVGAGLVQALLAVSQFINQHVGASTLLGLAEHSATPGHAILQTGTGYVLRAYGSFPHPNILGAWLAVSLILALVIRCRVGKRGPIAYRLALDFAIGAIILGLILTFSRGAWLAAAAALIWLGLIAIKEYGWKRTLAAAGALLATVTIFIIPLRSVIGGRVSPSAGLETYSLTDRSATLRNGWDLFRANPLLGAGAGNSTAAIAEKNPMLPVRYAQPPHFTPLAAASEVGIVGLVFFLLWVWLHRPNFYNIFAPLYAVPLVAGLFDHYWWTLWPGISLLAVILALPERQSAPGEGGAVRVVD